MLKKLMPLLGLLMISSFSYANIRLYPETRKDLGWKSFFEKKIGGSRYVREPPSNLYLFLQFLDFLQWEFCGRFHLRFRRIGSSVRYTTFIQIK